MYLILYTIKPPHNNNNNNKYMKKYKRKYTRTKWRKIFISLTILFYISIIAYALVYIS